jgi:hypothetical protein
VRGEDRLVGQGVVQVQARDPQGLDDPLGVDEQVGGGDHALVVAEGAAQGHGGEAGDAGGKKAHRLAVPAQDGDPCAAAVGAVERRQGLGPVGGQEGAAQRRMGLLQAQPGRAVDGIQGRRGDRLDVGHDGRRADHDRTATGGSTRSSQISRQ